MTINQAVKLAKKILDKHPELKMWSVTLNKRKSSFGVCNYKNKEIQLSSITIPVMSDEGIEDTIIHEIAHALTPGQHHNNVWKRKCIELGGSGKRLGGTEKYKDGIEGHIASKESISKYKLTCPCCGNTGYMIRLPKRPGSCGKCSRVYNPKYEFIVTKL